MDAGILAKRAEKLIADNSPAILTGIGVVGALTSAYLAGTASFKAAEILFGDGQAEYYEGNGVYYGSKKEQFKAVWKLYIPAASTLALTTTAIIMANRIGTRRAAAMAAAYTTLEKGYKEYREKVFEKVGEKKEQSFRDELAQDRVNDNPGGSSLVINEDGKVLCHDTLTGRYFQSTVETIRKAQNDINAEIFRNMYATLSDFFNAIGLAPTAYSEEVGWNTDSMCEIYFSGTLTDDGKPCVAIMYSNTPVRNYNRMF